MPVIFTSRIWRKAGPRRAFVAVGEPALCRDELAVVVVTVAGGWEALGAVRVLGTGGTSMLDLAAAACATVGLLTDGTAGAGAGCC